MVSKTQLNEDQLQLISKFISKMAAINLIPDSLNHDSDCVTQQLRSVDQVTFVNSNQTTNSEFHHFSNTVNITVNVQEKPLNQKDNIYPLVNNKALLMLIGILSIILIIVIIIVFIIRRLKKVKKEQKKMLDKEIQTFNLNDHNRQDDEKSQQIDCNSTIMLVR